MDPLAVHLAMEKAARRAAGRRGPGRHRGRSSTGSSTRTARSPAARSATAPGRRRRPGAPATRWTGSRREMQQARPDRRGRHRRRARAGRRQGDAGRPAGLLVEPDPRRGQARAGSAGASAPGCGPTRRSSTSASAATCRRSPAPGTAEQGDLHRRGAARQVHRGGRRGHGPADGRPTPGSWCSARTCTSSTAAPTAPPRACPRSTRAGCWARRSARTRSPAWAAGSRSTAGSARWSSSCTRTSCGSPPTRCSTRSARPGTCSAGGTRSRSCCAPRSRWAPATGRST